ncbi:MAG: hypothetical protein MUE31_03765 [Candidatus Nanopelagicales bacterium]|jgi:hypothetical protein|nr:hypothetical protein [Candidatus Nanopelagicales bacterium]
MQLSEMTAAQIADLAWMVRPEPLLGPPFPSPVIADPTFLPPDRTPRGDWRMWAHSMLGLHAYSSQDGIAWESAGTVTRNALRPHILATPASGYRLSYEKTRMFLPIGLPWSSWIESRRGDDLQRWSQPVTLLRPSLQWHTTGRSHAVSNPCLVAQPDGSWRLYYSAGLTQLTDCGFPEPTFIGVATGPGPDGPFTPLPTPLLGPGDGPASLCAGAIKVLACADGWVGFQNAITWDGQHSGSQIWVLGSRDGLDWQVMTDRPALAPSGSGWMATHVYALDVRDTPVGPRMYFNARDGYHWTRGRERIGVATPA